MKKIEDKLRKIEKLLLGKKEALTFDEACNYTGISPSYMYKLTSSRKVPHYKPHGKLVYFKIQEINEWLLKNPVVTEEDIKSEAVKRVFHF